MTNYTKQDHARDVKILADAPEGSSHFKWHDEDDSVPVYLRARKGEFWVIGSDGVWGFIDEDDTPEHKWLFPCENSHSLSDIRTIVAMYEDLNHE